VARPPHGVDAAFERRKREHRRRATREAADPASRPILWEKANAASWPSHPESGTAIRSDPSLNMTRVGPRNAGRRPAVQVLVAHPTAKSASAAAHLRRTRRWARPRRMREVPDHQPARRGLRRDLRHRMHPRRAVVDVRQHQNRSRSSSRAGKVGLVSERQLEAVRAREACRRCRDRWEVVAFRDDDPPRADDALAISSPR